MARKQQIPTFNLQRSPKPQTSRAMPGHYRRRNQFRTDDFPAGSDWSLEFGASLKVGAWRLVLPHPRFSSHLDLQRDKLQFTMIKRLSVLTFLSCLAAWGTESLPAQSSSAVPVADLLRIKTVEVADQTMPLRRDGEVSLGSFPENIIFHYAWDTNSGRLPIRLQYKLEGYESAWQEGGGEMYLGVRFFNRQGDQVSQDTFKMSGESAGWKGSFKDSSLTHRRETVKVPEHASRVMLVISSAGPPATEGVYVMANLMVTRSSGSAPAAVLMQSPFDQQPYNEDTNQAPRGWMRDGNHASMAKIVAIGKDMATKAFAILDDDPFSHAEWHSTSETMPAVTPGEDLVVEWNEMFSMGVGDIQIAKYDNLMLGTYKFRVEEVDMFGKPTGASASLSVLVPPPFWLMPWFWGAILVGVIAIVFGAWRYLAWYGIRREML
jgi:hypothetical protein